MHDAIGEHPWMAVIQIDPISEAQRRFDDEGKARGHRLQSSETKGVRRGRQRTRMEVQSDRSPEKRRGRVGERRSPLALGALACGLHCALGGGGGMGRGPGQSLCSGQWSRINDEATGVDRRLRLCLPSEAVPPSEGGYPHPPTHARTGPPACTIAGSRGCQPFGRPWDPTLGHVRRRPAAPGKGTVGSSRSPPPRGWYTHFSAPPPPPHRCRSGCSVEGAMPYGLRCGRAGYRVRGGACGGAGDGPAERSVCKTPPPWRWVYVCARRPLSPVPPAGCALARGIGERMPRAPRHLAVQRRLRRISAAGECALECTDWRWMMPHIPIGARAATAADLVVAVDEARGSESPA